ncbi:MAG: SlyX family protein [Planctomycetota bacterium]
MPAKSIEQRVEDLEIALAHQDRLCEQLNAIVTKQNEKMMQLENLVPALQQQIRDLKMSIRDAPRSAEDEKPPHY